MSTIARTPVEAIEKCAEMIQAGDIDGLVQLYDPDIVMMMEPGKVRVGLDALREYFTPLLALRPKMKFTRISFLEADGVAQLSYRWEVTGTAPDGSIVEQKGVSSDVVRRRPDGSWAVIIDNPNGGANSEAA